jgi:protein SCO1/2
MKKILLFLLFVIPFFLLKAEQPGTQHPAVGIVEKLGDTIPLDLSFSDSDWQTVKLRDIITKPTILVLVYFHCPGICTPLLTNMADMVDNLGLTPGTDYNIITISFDPGETPQIADKWKSNYFSTLKKPIDPNSWRFMTGDSLQIKKLTDAVGFYYQPDGGDDFIHPAGLIILSPSGRLTKYIMGVDLVPGEIKLALTQAKENITTPTSSQFLTICFTYDPNKKAWVFDLTKGIGILLLTSVVVFFVVIAVKRKKDKKEGAIHS